MAGIRMANEEQQRGADAVERAKLAEKINVALKKIAANRARVAEAKAKHEKAINAARAEEGTAKTELVKSIVTYHDLRKRAVDLLPEVLVDGRVAIDSEVVVTKLADIVDPDELRASVGP